MDLRRFIRKIISENKLFNKSQVEQIANRFKDSSEELKNDIAIFGLFRQQAPFNQIQDVNQLQSKEQLNNLLSQWVKKTVGEMIKTNQFIDNRYLAEKYLKAYVDNVKSLGANARPFSMRNIEKELIDVVLNNGWIKEEKQKAVGIYEPNDSDVVYKDDDIWIIKGDTKAKCVLYGQGQSWCISKADLSNYTTYRINHGATIYFCMQPRVKGNVHTFVILNYGGKYGLADQTNQGKRSGGPEVAMPWSQIELEIPNLRGKKGYFPYVSISNEERYYSDLVAEGFYKDNLGQYILKNTKSLIVNGTRISPSDFIRDYVAHGNRIEMNQFSSLTDEMLNTLVEIGYRFNLESFKLLSESQKRRAAKIIFNRGRNIDFFIFEFLPQENKQEYISKIIHHPIEDPQYYAYLTDTQMQKALALKVANKWMSISDEEFYLLPENLKNIHIKDKINQSQIVCDAAFDYMPDDFKETYIEKNWLRIMPDSQYDKLSDVLKQKYLNDKIKNHKRVSDHQIPDMMKIVARTNLHYLAQK